MSRPFLAPVGRRSIRRVIAFLWVPLIFLLISSARPPSTLDWRLATITQANGFDIWSWEIRTLVSRGGQALFNRPSPRDGPALVRQYARLTQEDARARGARDLIWAHLDGSTSSLELDQAERKLDALDEQLAVLRPMVEATLGAEIESELRRDDVRYGLLTWRQLPGFPFLRPELVPGVFFQLGPLPDLLVVAPRDRIELIGSVLLQPDLGTSQIDSLENQTDRLGVSSVVTGIGGLAAYPSMVPDDSSVGSLLITVAHEWTHHYLALRPLGMSYFSSYDMREINETVADMVGHEVGGAVYDRYYAASAPAPVPTHVVASTRPDFWTLMRQIRVTVEGYLARNDVDGADAYMARARKDLQQDGYYIRRLNTAYLAFYGSYAKTANPYEEKLRRLRAQSGSLDAFLEDVSQVGSPADLDRILRETPGQPA